MVIGLGLGVVEAYVAKRCYVKGRCFSADELCNQLCGYGGQSDAVSKVSGCQNKSLRCFGEDGEVVRSGGAKACPAADEVSRGELGAIVLCHTQNMVEAGGGVVFVKAHVFHGTSEGNPSIRPGDGIGAGGHNEVAEQRPWKRNVDHLSSAGEEGMGRKGESLEEGAPRAHSDDDEFGLYAFIFDECAHGVALVFQKCLSFFALDMDAGLKGSGEEGAHKGGGVHLQLLGEVYCVEDMRGEGGLEGESFMHTQPLKREPLFFLPLGGLFQLLSLVWLQGHADRAEAPKLHGHMRVLLELGGKLGPEFTACKSQFQEGAWVVGFHLGGYHSSGGGGGFLSGGGRVDEGTGFSHTGKPMGNRQTDDSASEYKYIHTNHSPGERARATAPPPRPHRICAIAPGCASSKKLSRIGLFPSPKISARMKAILPPEG